MLPTTKYIQGSEQVDIWACPQANEIDSPDKWNELATLPNGQKRLVLGDQHGNFLKLVHSLITRGVVGTEPNDHTNIKNVYDELLAIEERHLAQLKKLQMLKSPQDDEAINALKVDIGQDLARFRAIIKDKLKLFRSDVLITLIGDVLCDRGSNDYLTLLLIDELKNKQPEGAKFEVLLSNHDDGFIRKSFGGGKDLVGSDTSQYNMKLLEKHEIIAPQEAEKLTKSYLSSIKLFSYSIDVDERGKIKGLQIFNHAVAGPKCLEALIQKYPDIFQGVTYKADTIIDLCRTIDAVNEKFQVFINQPGGIEAYHKILTEESGAIEQYVDEMRDKCNTTEELKRVNSTLPVTSQRDIKDPNYGPFTCLIWNDTPAKAHEWSMIEGITPRTGHGHIGELKEGQNGEDVKNMAYSEEHGQSFDGNAGKRKGSPGANPMLCLSTYSSISSYLLDIPNRINSAKTAFNTASENWGEQFKSDAMKNSVEAFTNKATELLAKGEIGAAVAIVHYIETVTEAVTEYHTTKKAPAPISSTQSPADTPEQILSQKITEAQTKIKPALASYRGVFASLCEFGHQILVKCGLRKDEERHTKSTELLGKMVTELNKIGSQANENDAFLSTHSCHSPDTIATNKSPSPLVGEGGRGPDEGPVFENL